MARIGQISPTTEEVNRTKEQLVRFLDDKLPDARQVVTDIEWFVKALIRDEVDKRW